MSNLNPNLKHRRRRKPEINVTEYVNRILAGDRVYLSKAITLVESTLPVHQEKAQAILSACIPHAGQSLRIGITGTPGVGKSTFIESFGKYLIEQGHQLGVLAIDPTSPLSKGSILGDKTRMEGLATDLRAFIRPSPAGESLGGVARKTRETILLCEAAGFDIILLETVGVGQSEVTVHAMTDFFLLLLLPGAGDELQGIKRGIVEMADLIAINKADGDRLALARQAKREYLRALHLYPLKASQWQPQVSLCSAMENKGIDEVWGHIQSYLKLTKENGYFEKNRQEQALFWLHETVQNRIRSLFYNNEQVQRLMPNLEISVKKEELTPFQAAEQLMNIFLKKLS